MADATTPFQETLTASTAAIQSLSVLEPEMIQATERVVRCLKNGHKVLACGNGGSAADAAHLVTEFVVRYLHDRPPYPAIALTESGSTLTAGGNDYGFDQVFARQVQALGQPGDVLIVFSTSGNSVNILQALERANVMKLDSIAFLGCDGGPAKSMATLELIVPNQSTARIQEGHAVLIHALCQMVEDAMATTP